MAASLSLTNEPSSRVEVFNSGWWLVLHNSASGLVRVVDSGPGLVVKDLP